MRIAFVDMFFSWPPHGGGDVDMYHVMRGAVDLGHTVHLFVVRDEDTWERGRLETSLPFPATVLPFGGAAFNGEAVAEGVKRAVSGWEPETVFVGQGLLMKPYLLRALRNYPLVSRHHAHEAACLRDMLRFRDNQPCPNAYVRTPEACRQCALDRWGPSLRRGEQNAWLREFVGARAWTPDYHRVVLDGFAAVDIAIVTNSSMVEPLAGLPGEICIIPSGVDSAAFAAPPWREKSGERKVLLMAGRAEDPAKGYAVLARAADRLWRARQDFEVWATLPQDLSGAPWLKPLGWVDQAALRAFYARAALCVVPSVWEEPFGLVAAEAMAAGRPVVASRVGGLAEIVEDGVTGKLFPAGDADTLAEILDLLLDHPEVCAVMGQAGEARVKRLYDWGQLMERHYRPLWDRLAAIAGGKGGG